MTLEGQESPPDRVGHSRGGATHRSRVQAVVLDQPDAGADAALTLWSTVLGSPAGGSKALTYYELGEAEEVDLVLQRTGGQDAGAHLDIETDDLEAEVRRLQEAGAVLVDHVEDHVVLQDSGGLLLCVVPITDRDRFERWATSWHRDGSSTV